MKGLDWISRHIYHRLLMARDPLQGEEFKHCMTADGLLTGKANASKPLVQVIPLKNKNIKKPRKKVA